MEKTHVVRFIFYCRRWIMPRLPHDHLIAALALACVLIGALTVSLWLGRRADRERRRLEAARLAAEEKARAADEAARISSVAARLAETEAARARRQAEVAQSETAAVVEVLEAAEKTKPHPAPPARPLGTQEIAKLVGKLPRSELFALLWKIMGLRRWWETAEGKARMGERLAEQEREAAPKKAGPDEI